LLVHDALGYESIVANWNSALAIPWFLADFSVDYLTVVGGMEQVPANLVREFELSCRGAVHRGYNLIGIEQIEDRGKRLVKLTFDLVSDEMTTVNNTVSVIARNVILAIPKEPLKRLRFTGVAGWNQKKWLHWLDSVTEHSLFKLFLAYEHAWWKDPRALGNNSGRAVTDLPIRQVYYFNPTKRGRGLLMACYSDEHYVDYWRHVLTRNKREFFYTGKKQLTASEKNDLRLLGISSRIVHKARRQLMRLHPKMGSRVPMPYVGIAKYWTGDEGWGWHTWNPHFRPWKVARDLARPFFGNIHTCGEAFSFEQGWAEGALRSAEIVLKNLGISPPDWIKRKDYFDLGYLGGYDEYIGVS
jgi:monoamine oxidase